MFSKANSPHIIVKATSPKVYRHMRADKDLYLSFFISAVQGCGKRLLAEIVALAKSEGYESRGIQPFLRIFLIPYAVHV